MLTRIGRLLLMFL